MEVKKSQIQNNKIDTEWMDKKLSKVRVIFVSFLYVLIIYLLFSSSCKPESLLKLCYIVRYYLLSAIIISSIYNFLLRKPPQITEEGIKLSPYSTKILLSLLRFFTLHYFLYGLFSQYKKPLLFIPWSQIKQISITQTYPPFVYLSNLSYGITLHTLDKKVYSQYINDKKGFIEAIDRFGVEELKSVKSRRGNRWSR